MGPTPDTRSPEELKSIVIPALFAEPSRIGEYGPKSGGATNAEQHQRSESRFGKNAWCCD